MCTAETGENHRIDTLPWERAVAYAVQALCSTSHMIEAWHAPSQTSCKVQYSQAVCHFTVEHTCMAISISISLSSPLHLFVDHRATTLHTFAVVCGGSP